MMFQFLCSIHTWKSKLGFSFCATELSFLLKKFVYTGKIMCASVLPSESTLFGELVSSKVIYLVNLIGVTSIFAARKRASLKWTECKLKRMVLLRDYFLAGCITLFGRRGVSDCSPGANTLSNIMPYFILHTVHHVP